jgi:6-phosphogluconolactonase (cycloisomerase 2 family)
VAYVGTFSSPLKDVLPTQVDLPPGNGRGIHVFHADRATGRLEPAGLFESGTSPSHLVASADRRFLYSANETDRTGDDGQGTVSAFRIERATGALSLVNRVPSGGAGPTFVSLHQSERWLFVANYFGGTVAVLPVRDDGSLGPATDVRTDEGPLGPTRASSAPPGSFAISGHDRTHAHMIAPDPSGRCVLHTDLGLDRIYAWRFDPANGRLLPAETPWTSLPPGDGPRHFAFHPDGRRLYSIQEEGSTVAAFDYDPDRGTLILRQTVSTLPAGFAGSNFCSGLAVSRDGRTLYAGNRLHDSVAVFSISADGTLALRAEAWTRGSYPRSFTLDPSGRFLHVCNQRADHVALFRVEPTGDLEFTGHYTPVGNPSCVAFVDLGPEA